MDVAITSWLSSVSGLVFRTCAFLFVVLNLGAVALVVGTRSRALVQRWTSPWLAANFLLIGAGAGVPLVAGIAQAAVHLVSGSAPVEIQIDK
ncbi:MAG TPA: hypothetical protein VLL51_07165 [Gemmatimonadales bacterium]|nr:hypothetical protein [Gemmatimonadales bacterium]